jgi:hypothetical protein
MEMRYMKIAPTFVVLPMLWLCSCALNPTSIRDVRLYDTARDEQAQNAAKLVVDLQSQSLFEKQLRNVSTLAKQDFTRHFLLSHTEMRAKLGALQTWTDVDQTVKSVRAQLTKPPTYSKGQLAALQQDLDKRLSDAKTAAEQLKDSIAEKSDKTLTVWADRIGDIVAIEASARALFRNDKADKAAAHKSFTEVFMVLHELYSEYQKVLNTLDKVEAELQDFKKPLKEVVLQQLRLEEGHWKNVAAIEARRVAEEADLRELIDDYEISAKRRHDDYHIKPEAKLIETIEGAMRNRDRERLSDLLLMLHTTTALVSRGATPARLSTLRLAHEEHHYSIRQSSAAARTYEVVISTGVRRLALYYKNGLKPELVAQVIHAAAAAAIPPAILAR